MREVSRPPYDPNRLSLVAAAARICTLLLPALLLLVTSSRAAGSARVMLLLGAAFQIVVCCFSFLSRKSWNQPAGPSIIALYLIAFGWLCLGSHPRDAGSPPRAKAFLRVVPLSFFAMHPLARPGPPATRGPRLRADRLARRKDWPDELA